MTSLQLMFKYETNKPNHWKSFSFSMHNMFFMHYEAFSRSFIYYEAIKIKQIRFLQIRSTAPTC
jgi:hypothetical protein